MKLLTVADMEANYKKTFLPTWPRRRSITRKTWGTWVCVISPTMAISSDHFRRVAKDGSVMMEGYGHYLYTKSSDGWHLTAAIGSQLRKI